MNIVCPYKSDELDKKNKYDTHDMVERDGFVSNERKIESFIETGMVLTEYHANASEYDIPEEESEYEQDTPEYLEELTKQAENYKETPLLQHLDKITAEEVLAEADLALERASKVNTQKKPKDASERLIEALERNSKAIAESAKKSAKAEAEPTK